MNDKNQENLEQQEHEDVRWFVTIVRLDLAISSKVIKKYQRRKKHVGQSVEDICIKIADDALIYSIDKPMIGHVGIEYAEVLEIEEAT